MANYRFFGSESALANGMTLTKYGQVVELETGEADALIAAHPPALLLSEDLWAKCDITDDELVKFPSTTIHSTAPEDFRMKTSAVRLAWHEYREGLLKAEAEKRTFDAVLPIAAGAAPSRTEEKGEIDPFTRVRSQSQADPK